MSTRAAELRSGWHKVSLIEKEVIVVTYVMERSTIEAVRTVSHERITRGSHGKLHSES